MAIRVGINGFGRIGRLVFRVLSERDEFEIMAVNDLADAKTLATLLKYDSAQGKFQADVSSDGSNIVLNGKKIPVLAEKDPAKLPWKANDVYFAVESTGVFRAKAGNGKAGYDSHIQAGAKKVLLTVPSKDEVDATIVLGVNDDELKPEHKCISNASCTTNCLAPVVKVLHENFGIKQALMTTCHAYTNDQRVADMIHSDLRRARAAAINIIPTTTGAAKAITKIFTDLKGRIDGLSLRVPVITGSIVDLVVETQKDATADAINAAMKDAASKAPLKGILEYCEDPIVSSDIIHNPASSIFDPEWTMKVGDNMIKVLSWYDNEWGYSNRVVDLMAKAAKM